MKHNGFKILMALTTLAALVTGCASGPSMPTIDTTIGKSGFSKDVEKKAEEFETQTEVKYELALIVLPPVPEYQLSGGELQIWVNKNEMVPYDGILLSPEAMSHIISLYDFQRDTFELTVKKQQESDLEVLKIETGKLLVELDSQKKKSDIRLESKDQEIKRLQEISKDISKSKSNILRDILFVGGGTAVGIAIGVVIMAVAK